MNLLTILNCLIIFPTPTLHSPTTFFHTYCSIFSGYNVVYINLNPRLPTGETWQHVHSITYLEYLKSKSYISKDWIYVPLNQNHQYVNLADALFTDKSNVITIQYKFKFEKAIAALYLYQLLSKYQATADIVQVGTLTSEIYNQQLINAENMSEFNLKRSLWIQDYNYWQQPVNKYHIEIIKSAFESYKTNLNIETHRDINKLYADNPYASQHLFSANNNLCERNQLMSLLKSQSLHQQFLSE